MCATKETVGVGLPAFVDDNKILTSLPAQGEEKGYLGDMKNRMLEALWDKNNRSGGTKMWKVMLQIYRMESEHRFHGLHLLPFQSEICR